MTPRETRRAIRERARQVRKQLALQRRARREALAKDPLFQKAAARRARRRQVILATILLLLLLLIRCDCSTGPINPMAIPAGRDAGLVMRDAGVLKPGPLKAHVRTQPRPQFEGPAPVSPSWLDSFRLQVSARSPRLATCFTGSEAPGALRWTTSVEPHSGVVSDHRLELAAPGNPTVQNDCVIKVLNDPPYTFENAPAQIVPSRVSLIIEF